jgi:teichuronic acid biosynthesis glycosyltransferase TuaC
MRVLTISTLHPSEAQPNFGRFVQLSLDAADATGEAEIVRICPNGVPPWPLSQLISKYRAQAALPKMDGTIYRPRWALLPGMAPARNARAIAKAVLPIARRMHREKPFDAVDAQFFWPDGPAAMIVARALHLPFSIKARGADIHYWSEIAGCRELIIDAAQKAGGLLAVSQAIKADIAALGVDSAKIRVHHTGIDRSVFNVPDAPRSTIRATMPIPADGPLLVSVGALIPRKGQSFVIEALPALPGAQLALIGAGEDMAQLEILSSELGVADRVHFFGSLPHAEIARFVQAADVAVLPSSSEGLANAWIEALACGTPLVITDVGGAREVIHSPDGGRIVARNAAAIAKAVSELLAQPIDRQQVAATVADFSWDRNGSALIAHWQALIGF